MKKTLLSFALCCLTFTIARAQCVPTCSNYIIVPTTYSTYPTGGTNVNSLFVPTADDGTVNVPIGFSFNYYCGTYTAVNICANGFIQIDYGNPIQFGTPPYANPVQFLPSTATPNAIIALRMDDLDATSATGGGSVTYTTIGVAPSRMFVVSFNSVPIWSHTTFSVTGQIVLFETSNNIEVQSYSIDQGPNTATQGLENTLGTLGGGVTGRNASLWSASQDAYLFAPVSAVAPGSISGSASPCVGAQVLYSVGAAPTATSYNWSYPGGWSGTSTTTAFQTTVGAAGTISVSANYTCGASPASTFMVSSVTAPLVSLTSTSSPVLCSGDTISIVPSGATVYTLNPGNITTAPFVIISDTSTNYSLIGMDPSTGCMSSNAAQIYFQVNASPSVAVTSGSICSGQSFSIVATGADNFQYSSGFNIVSPTAPGIYTYSVTGMNLNGCSSSPPSISTVTVNAIPVLSVTAQRATICRGETAVITASGAATYVWNTSATTNTLATPVLTATAVFTVTGTSAEGCLKVKTITIQVSACTGIEQYASQDAGVSVYPNPASGLFNVNIESVNGKVNLEVFDATGRLIIAQETDQQTIRMDLSNQAQGLYYMKVKNGDASQTLKLIKQ